MKQLFQKFIPTHVDVETITKGQYFHKNLAHRGLFRYSETVFNSRAITPRAAAITKTPANRGENQLTVWGHVYLPPSSYVRIKSSEYEVTYHDPMTNEVSLKTPLLENCDCNTEVLLLSTLFRVQGDYDIGARQFVLISEIPIFETDRISIDDQRYVVVNVNREEDQYDILVDRPFVTNVSNKFGRLQTTSAIESDAVHYFDREVVGPHIVDFFHGTHFFERDVKVRGFLKLWNGERLIRNKVFTDLENNPLVVMDQTIVNTNFLTSKKIEGQFDFVGNQFCLITDPCTHRAAMELDCQPHLPNEDINEWIAILHASRECKLVIGLPPNPAQEFLLRSGINRIAIAGAAQQAFPIERMRFGISSDGPCTVHFSDLTSPNFITHITYVLSMYSETDFVTNHAYFVSQPVLKNIFLDTRTTFASLDNTTRLNSGYVFTPVVTPSSLGTVGNATTNLAGVDLF